MQSDDTIWSVCGDHFCSFRAKFLDTKLCRNLYNVSGECAQSVCPLANSYYGTILEEEGVCYLYLKTIERAHTPRKLWEKIRLDDNLEKAMDQIELHMRNIYKDPQIERCKKRLARIRQYLAQMRRLAVRPEVVASRETSRLMTRETNREIAALKAANIQQTVQEELLKRLREGHYGSIYNYPAQEFSTMLKDSTPDVIEDDEVERGESELDSEDEEDDIEDVAELA